MQERVPATISVSMVHWDVCGDGFLDRQDGRTIGHGSIPAVIGGESAGGPCRPKGRTTNKADPRFSCATGYEHQNWCAGAASAKMISVQLSAGMRFR